MKDLSHDLKKIKKEMNTLDPKNIYKKSSKDPKKDNSKNNQNIIRCKECDDLYWISPENEVGANQFGKYILCECVQHIVTKNKQKSFSSSQNFGDITLSMRKNMTFPLFKLETVKSKPDDEYNLHGAIEVARQYYKENKGWLVLRGPTGVGKTHLAAAITNERLKSFLPVYFGFVPSILERLRKFNEVNNSQEFGNINFLSYLIECPFLVIDDLGHQSSSPWAEDKLYQIIVGRHASQLPTIITTRALISNTGEDDLVFNPQISEAIKSRLHDFSVVNEYTIVAPDYRTN